MKKEARKELQNIKDNTNIELEEISGTIKNYHYAMQFIYERGLDMEFRLWLGSKALEEISGGGNTILSNSIEARQSVGAALADLEGDSKYSETRQLLTTVLDNLDDIQEAVEEERTRVDNSIDENLARDEEKAK